MRVVGIVQARMGSTRLPGKSMADLAGRPLLWHFLARAKRARRVDALVLATTQKAEDDVLADVARGCDVAVFRGSESDLVDRFHAAARAHAADVVVRLCADNPVVEPAEIDRIVERHAVGDRDFSSNCCCLQPLPRGRPWDHANGYPDGLGAEVFGLDRLTEVWRESTDPVNREHPHTYFYEHPDRFRIGSVPCPDAFRRPDLVLDVNTPGELAFVRAIYEHWYPRKPDFHITDIIAWQDAGRAPARRA